MRTPLLLVVLVFGLSAACRGPASSDRSTTGAASAAALSSATCDPSATLFDGVPGIFPGTRFAPLALHELTAEGTEVPLSTDDLRRPCVAGAPRLLVVRLDAQWCGTCIASADGYGAALRPFADAITTLDVVFSGADNGPATLGDAKAWRAAHPSLPGHIARADNGAAGDLLHFQRVAPAVFLVELPSMRIRLLLQNPTPVALANQVRGALRELGVASVANAVAPAPLVDGRFSPEDWALLQAMRARVPPPPDETNAHADDPAAALLGKELFSDAALGGGAKTSCATCHVPARAFTDGLPTAHGVTDTDMNTPGLGPAAYNRWWFWDGRADSLWAQATSPIENAREMNGSRLGVLRRLSERYRKPYERLFGELPRATAAAGFPRAGKPGDPAYDALPVAERDAVTRAFVNAAKALAAYERTLRPRRSRFDAYLAGTFDSLSVRERDGVKVFLEAGCAVCHHGPMLTDGAFHDIRMPSRAGDGPPARGRVDGVRALLESPFRQSGPFSDAPSAGARLAGLAPTDAMLGQMKTPSLRDVAFTGPFGHGGTFATLEAVVGHYDVDELTDGDPGRIGALDPAVPAFAPTPERLEALLGFLRVVGGQR